MAEAASLLRRKLAPTRPATAPGGSSLAALLGKTMPRDADELLGLDLSVGAVVVGEAMKPSLLDGMSTHDLVYRMEDEGGARGLCRLTPGLVAGLIEIQMSGRISLSEPAARAATRTDGLLCGDIVDQWFATAARLAVEVDLTSLLPSVGFKRKIGILDRRNADLWLEPIGFRTLSVELALGEAKNGTLFVATPLPVQSELKGGKYAQLMRRHLPDLPTEMRVVLTRMPLALTRARKLAVGDVIDVPPDTLLNVRLEGAHGHLIAEGRLGQLGGRKAVRLTPLGETGATAPRDTAALPAVPPSSMATSGVLPDPLGLPDLPDLPDLSDPPGLPDLSELPGLPDLPNLPDFPELPDFPDP